MNTQQQTNDTRGFEDLFRGLDVLLEFFSDDESAGLREQFVFACNVVRGEQDKVRATQAELEAAKRAVDEQLRELAAEREALRVEKLKVQEEQGKLQQEQVKLRNLTETVLPSKFQELSQQICNVSDNVKSSGSAMAQTVQAANIAIAANTSAQEEVLTLLKDGINSKLDNLSGSVQAHNEMLTSSEARSTRTLGAIEAVGETQQRLSTTMNGITGSLSTALTEDILESHIQPLMAKMEVSAQSIAELPSASVIADTFNGELIAGHQEALLMQRDQRNHFEDERNRFAKDLRDERDRVSRRDSHIQNLRSQIMQLTDELGTVTGERDDTSQKLEEAQVLVQQAKLDRQLLHQARSELEQEERLSRQLREETDLLKAELASNNQLNVECSKQLAATQESLKEATAAQHKLYESRSKAQNKLETFRSERAYILQEQLKAEWANEKAELQSQLDQQRSQFDIVTELKDSWEKDKRDRYQELVDERAVSQDREGRINHLSSQVSRLEKELDVAKKGAVMWENTASIFESDAEDKGTALINSDIKLSRATNDIQSLKSDLEDQRNKTTDEANLRQSLEQQLRLVKGDLEKAVADQEAHQCLEIPTGVTGDLAKMYLRLADEFRYIQSVHDTSGEVDLSKVAAGLAPLLHGQRAKNNLLNFLQSSPKGCYCLEQVVQTESPPEVNDAVCPSHNGCVLVTVVLAGGNPALKFSKAV